MLVIIVILVAAIGVVMSLSTTAKQPAKLEITSDNEQYGGGELSLQLMDSNKTPISNKIVNITITDSNGNVVVDDVAKTDSNGEAKLNLDLKKGEYNVTASYGGDENYSGNNTSQKLTIKEEVTQTEDVTTVDSIEKYRTRSDTYLKVMPSGDVVEMSADGSIVVSVNGDPHASF